MSTAAIYTALDSLSQGFEQALSAIDLLSRAEFANRDLFDGCRMLTEEAAAWSRYQVVQALGDKELRAWTACGRRSEDWEKRNGKAGEGRPASKQSRRTTNQRGSKPS